MNIPKHDIARQRHIVCAILLVSIHIGLFHTGGAFVLRIQDNKICAR